MNDVRRFMKVAESMFSGQTWREAVKTIKIPNLLCFHKLIEYDFQVEKVGLTHVRTAHYYKCRCGKKAIKETHVGEM